QRPSIEFTGELSQRELLVLKEIRLTGRTNDRTMALRLLNDDMIADLPNTYLQLTPKGRKMLVRGSPSLWAVA
ncbi:MAG: hypothetical protein WCD54_21630, partial [Pseudolabrys sp.]